MKVKSRLILVIIFIIIINSVALSDNLENMVKSDLNGNTYSSEIEKKYVSMGESVNKYLRPLFYGGEDTTRERIMRIMSQTASKDELDMIKSGIIDKHPSIRYFSFCALSHLGKKGYLSEKEKDMIKMEAYQRNELSDDIKIELANNLSMNICNIKIKCENLERMIKVYKSAGKSNLDYSLRQNFIYYLNIYNNDAIPIIDEYIAKTDSLDVKYCLYYDLYFMYKSAYPENYKERANLDYIANGLRNTSLLNEVRLGLSAILRDLEDKKSIPILKELLQDKYCIKSRNKVIYPIRENAKRCL